jgi:hypothetical protein
MRHVRLAEARATRSTHGRDRPPGCSRQDKRCAREGPASMKSSASRIERMLAKVEARLVPPPRKCLRVIVHEGDDEAGAMEKALAEHVASHPEDAGRTVQDLKWILNVIVRWPAQGTACGLRSCAILNGRRLSSQRGARTFGGPKTAPGRCRLGSGTETFSTRCVTPSWHRTGSKTFGAIRGRYAGVRPELA